MTAILPNRYKRKIDEVLDEDGETSFNQIFPLESIKKNLLSEFDTPSSNRPSDIDSIKVYLRLRPFLKEELRKNEDQGCMDVDLDCNKVKINAPKESHMFKNRSVVDTVNEFAFTKIFGGDCSQKNFFESTTLPHVEEFLLGADSLIFTYGVTNAGKSFTINGPSNNVGILPRFVDVLFNSTKDRLIENVKFQTRNAKELQLLSAQELQKNMKWKQEIIDLVDAEPQSEDTLLSFRTSTCSGTSETGESITMSDRDSLMVNDLARTSIGQVSDIADRSFVEIPEEAKSKYAIFMSFVELYKEQIFDLLVPVPDAKSISKIKRPALQIGEDMKGIPFVKGVREIQINSREEMMKLLQFGRKHLHMAATKLNHNSSRSHCVFTVKAVQMIDPDNGMKANISTISFCDLAGSERSKNTRSVGIHLREASKINLSLLTLGKCLEGLRQKKGKKFQQLPPFRESSLTRLFKRFFTGKGIPVMIVNASQCASSFDETVQAFKMSAIAREIRKPKEEPRKSRVSWNNSIYKRSRSARTTIAWENPPIIEEEEGDVAVAESVLAEESTIPDSEEEGSGNEEDEEVDREYYEKREAQYIEYYEQLKNRFIDLQKRYKETEAEFEKFKQSVDEQILTATAKERFDAVTEMQRNSDRMQELHDIRIDEELEAKDKAIRVRVDFMKEQMDKMIKAKREKYQKLEEEFAQYKKDHENNKDPPTEKLEATSTQHEEEKKKLQESIDKLSDEKEELQTARDFLEERTTKLQDECTRLQKQNKKHFEVEKRCETLEAAKKELETSHEFLDNLTKNLQKECAQLHRDNESIAELQKRCSDLKEENSLKDARIETMESSQGDLQHKNEQIAELKKCCEDLKVEVTMKQKKLDEREHYEEEKNRENTRLQTKISTLESVEEELRNKLSSMHDSANMKRNNEVTQMKDAMTEFDKTQQEQQAVIEKLLNEKRELETSHEFLDNLTKNLQKECAQLHRDNESLPELQKQYDELKKDNSTKETQIKELQTSHRNMMEMDVKITKLQRQCEDHETREKSLSEEARKEVESLRKNLRMKEEQIAELTKQHRDHNKNISLKEKQIDELENVKDDVCKKSEKIAELEHRLKQLDDNLSLKSNRVAELEGTLDEVCAKNVTALTNLEKMGRDCDEWKRELSAKEETFEEKLAAAETRNQEMSRLHDELKKEKVYLHSKITKLENDCVDVEKDKEKELANFRETRDKIVAALEKKMNNQASSIELLKKKLDEQIQITVQMKSKSAELIAEKMALERNVSRNNTPVKESNEKPKKESSIVHFTPSTNKQTIKAEPVTPSTPVIAMMDMSTAAGSPLPTLEVSLARVEEEFPTALPPKPVQVKVKEEEAENSEDDENIPPQPKRGRRGANTRGRAVRKTSSRKKETRPATPAAPAEEKEEEPAPKRKSSTRSTRSKKKSTLTKSSDIPEESNEVLNDSELQKVTGNSRNFPEPTMEIDVTPQLKKQKSTRKRNKQTTSENEDDTASITSGRSMRRKNKASAAAASNMEKVGDYIKNSPVANALRKIEAAVSPSRQMTQQSTPQQSSLHKTRRRKLQAQDISLPLETMTPIDEAQPVENVSETPARLLRRLRNRK